MLTAVINRISIVTNCFNLRKKLTNTMNIQVAVLDILLQVEPMTRAQPTGMHPKVHDADSETRPGDECRLKYSQLYQPTFLRPTWRTSRLIWAMSPEQTSSDGKSFAASFWIHGEGLSRKPHNLLPFLNFFVLTSFQFFSEYGTGLGRIPPWRWWANIEHTLLAFHSFFCLADRFIELADRSSLLFSGNHGVPRPHLSVFAGHPTDATWPISL